MRLTLLVFALFVCGSCGSGPSARRQAGDPLANGKVHRTVIATTRINGGVEFTYAVDLEAQSAILQPAGDAAAKKAAFLENYHDKDRQAVAAYARLVSGIAALHGRAIDPDLAALMDYLAEPYHRSDFASSLLPSPDGKRLAFTSDSPLPVMIVDLETLVVRRVTSDNDSLLFTPIAWSADSRRLIFTPQLSPKIGIYDIDGRTSFVTRRGDGGRIQAIAWSPDGSEFALVAHRNRWMKIDPVSLLGFLSGHPVFRNDQVLQVYDLADGSSFDISLRRGITESSTPSSNIIWK